jgi:hypothetical protein
VIGAFLIMPKDTAVTAVAKGIFHSVTGATQATPVATVAVTGSGQKAGRDTRFALPHQLNPAGLAHIGEIGGVEGEQVIDAEVDVFQHFADDTIGQGVGMADAAGALKYGFQGGVPVSQVIEQANGGALEDFFKFQGTAPVAHQSRRYRFVEARPRQHKHCAFGVDKIGPFQCALVVLVGGVYQAQLETGIGEDEFGHLRRVFGIFGYFLLAVAFPGSPLAPAADKLAFHFQALVIDGVDTVFGSQPNVLG